MHVLYNAYSSVSSANDIAHIPNLERSTVKPIVMAIGCHALKAINNFHYTFAT